VILADVLIEARRLLQDTSTDAALQRYSDAFLLDIANTVLKRAAILRPDLFSEIGEIDCVQDETLQSAPEGAFRIMDVFRVQGGNAIREVNKATFDQTAPEWVTDDPGTCVCWMRHTKNPLKFFIYPPAPASQTLIGEYAKTPVDYDESTEVELLPDAYFPAIVDGLIWLVESGDNEHVDSGRAKMFQESFLQSLGASMAAQAITDAPDAIPAKKGTV
jgi:hypothetical protein